MTELVESGGPKRASPQDLDAAMAADAEPVESKLMLDDSTLYARHKVWTLLDHLLQRLFISSLPASYCSMDYFLLAMKVVHAMKEKSCGLGGRIVDSSDWPGQSTD
jgi:hypothetical protein